MTRGRAYACCRNRDARDTLALRVRNNDRFHYVFNLQSTAWNQPLHIREDSNDLATLFDDDDDDESTIPPLYTRDDEDSDSDSDDEDCDDDFDYNNASSKLEGERNIVTGTRAKLNVDCNGHKFRVNGNDMTRYILTNFTYNTEAERVPVTNSFEVLDFIDVCSDIKRKIRTKRARLTEINRNQAQARPGNIPRMTVEKTIAATTQLAKLDARLPMRKHFKSRFSQLNKPRLSERYDTDTWFSSTAAVGGENCFQIFNGRNSGYIKSYGMIMESEGPTKLQDFINKVGATFHIHNDNSKMQMSKSWKDILRTYNIGAPAVEPHHPHQNPTERKIKSVKNGIIRIMDSTNTPMPLWFQCCIYWCMLLSIIALKKHKWKTLTEVAFGVTPDISAFLQYKWFEPVYYLDEDGVSFSNSKEKLGRWIDIVENCGDSLAYKIWKPETEEILYRSEVRSTRIANGKPNHRALEPHLIINNEEDGEPTALVTKAELVGENIICEPSVSCEYVLVVILLSVVF